MNLTSFYSKNQPDFFRDICESAPMKRLAHVGMNCGCEYSSTSVFYKIGNYTRLEHSLGAGLIVWHFTGDARQSVSALLHDIATPCFAHVIDFLHGDYVSQESTEDKTLEIIRGDAGLVATLSRLGLKPEDVCDYHLFPIADNDTPRLSSDRLEYTLGNGVNYGFIDEEKAKRYYDDLEVGVNEDGAPEIVFRTSSLAVEFARLALRCSKIYCGDEDRYLMQMLSELIRDAISSGVISESDLHTDEPSVITKLLSDEKSAAAWRHYCSIKRVGAGIQGPLARVVNAKKRHINPLVSGLGRVSEIDPSFALELKSYLSHSFDYPVSEY